MGQVKGLGSDQGKPSVLVQGGLTPEGVELSSHETEQR